MNDPQLPLPKAVVFAYFANQATPLERKQTENWMATEEGLAMYFNYLDDWECQHPQFYADVDQARQRFWDFIHQPSQLTDVNCDHELPSSAPEQPTTRLINWLPTRWLMAVAASLLLLIGLWMTFDNWYYQTLHNGYSQIRSVQLPDGSGVVLGVHSSLRYARFGFGTGTNRQVWLTGEARFEVEHQPNDQLFTVQTPDQITVEVMGTTFLVNSRRHTTQVTLEKGSIQLIATQLRKPLRLVPGDIVTVSAKGQFHHKRQPVSPAYVTWHDHRFVFNDTPLSDVVAQLHDTFGVTVQIPHAEIMTRTVSGTFRAETPDDLLQALALMMNLQLSKNRSLYRLTWPEP